MAGIAEVAEGQIHVPGFQQLEDHVTDLSKQVDDKPGPLALEIRQGERHQIRRRAHDHPHRTCPVASASPNDEIVGEPAEPCKFLPGFG